MSSPLLWCRPVFCRRGFTLVEILAAVGIIAILAALSLTGFKGAIESKNRMVCTQRLYAVGRALQLYVVDNNGFYPAIRDDRADGSTWYGTRTLYPYFDISDKQRATQQALGVGPADTLYECPSEKKENHFTMTSAMRDWSSGSSDRMSPRRANTISRPSQTILFYEAVDGSNNDLAWSTAKIDLGQSDPSKTKALAFRHRGTMNTLHGDGHVEGVDFKNRSSITQAMWEGYDRP